MTTNMTYSDNIQSAVSATNTTSTYNYNNNNNNINNISGSSNNNINNNVSGSNNNTINDSPTQTVAVRLSQEVLFFPIPFTDVAIENVVQIKNLLGAEPTNNYSTNVIAFKALSAIRHRYSVHPPVGFIPAGGAVNLTFSIDPKVIMRSGDPALRVLPTKDSHDAIYLDFAIVPASDMTLLQRWNYRDRNANNNIEVQEDAAEFWKKHGPATGRSGVIATSTSTGTAVMRKRLACVFGTQDEAPQSLVMRLKAEGKSVPTSASTSTTTNTANVSVTNNNNTMMINNSRNSNSNSNSNSNNNTNQVCATQQEQINTVNNVSSSQSTSTRVITPKLNTPQDTNNTTNPVASATVVQPTVAVKETCYVEDASPSSAAGQSIPNNITSSTMQSSPNQTNANLITSSYNKTSSNQSTSLQSNATPFEAAQPTSVKTYIINDSGTTSSSSAPNTISVSATSHVSNNNNNNQEEIFNINDNNSSSTSIKATDEAGKPLWKQVMDYRIPYRIAVVLVIVAIFCGMLETNSFFTWLIAGK